MPGEWDSTKAVIKLSQTEYQGPDQRRSCYVHLLIHDCLIILRMSFSESMEIMLQFHLGQVTLLRKISLHLVAFQILPCFWIYSYHNHQISDILSVLHTPPTTAYWYLQVWLGVTYPILVVDLYGIYPFSSVTDGNLFRYSVRHSNGTDHCWQIAIRFITGGSHSYLAYISALFHE